MTDDHLGYFAPDYRNAREGGQNAKEAAHTVLTSIGRALVITSSVLCAGFIVIIPSILASLARFGMLMALCLFLALLFDLLMTPAVLAWLERVRHQPGHVPML